MKPHLLFAGILLTCGFFTPVRADISPTEFAGSGIVPVHAAGVRMVSAKVDIEWGFPCTMAAVFVMENATAKPVEVQLGFPLDLPGKFVGKDELGFSMAFDGVPVKPSELTRVGEGGDMGPTWYRCRHAFAPGQTQVTIQTKLPAGRVYRTRFGERLAYCIETGASWEGTIGSEEVTVHFPRPVSPGMILEATPPGYQVEGSTVRWEFKDFEPKGKDHDIAIAYLRPDVVAVLELLRQKHAQDPADAKATLELAKHLFVLNRDDRPMVTPPSEVTRADFEALLKSIPDLEDRAFLASLYGPNETGWAKGGFERKKDGENPRDEFKAITIISQTGYQVYFRKSPYLDEARALVEGLVKAQQKNAAAWNVHLANYYRYGFAGAEPSKAYGQESYFPPQAKLIREAHLNCPDDPCIQLWYKRSHGGQATSFATWESRNDETSGPGKKDELWQKLQQQGVFAVSYREIDYGYW